MVILGGGRVLMSEVLLYPIPQSLHPKPCTNLNPKPSILKLQPSTLNHPPPPSWRLRPGLSVPGLSRHSWKGEEGDLFIDNPLVRIHFIIEMIRWTGLAPWLLKFPFPGSLTSACLDPPRQLSIALSTCCSAIVQDREGEYLPAFRQVLAPAIGR